MKQIIKPVPKVSELNNEDIIQDIYAITAKYYSTVYYMVLERYIPPDSARKIVHAVFNCYAEQRYDIRPEILESFLIEKTFKFCDYCEKKITLDFQNSQ